MSLEEIVTDPQNGCILCMHAKQHFCRKCLKPVCNVFCSEQDPSSTNEMHRKHKEGDVRCISSGFECPMCSKKFMTQLELQSHIEIEHEQEQSLSLLSEASSGWINEGSTVQEKDDFISEVSTEYLLKEVDNDEHLLKQPDTSIIQTHGRIVQNLHNIDFDEDSDEDIEYNPINEENENDDEEQYVEEEEMYSCTSCDFETKYEHNFKRHKLNKHKGDDGVNSKRKKKNIEPIVPNKKTKQSEISISDLICDVCEINFTRKDNLKRHKLKKH